MKAKHTNNVHTDSMLREWKAGKERKGIKLTISAFDLFFLLPVLSLGGIVLVLIYG